MKRKRVGILIIAALTVVFLFEACQKDKKDPIPDTYVSFYLNISSTLYLNLTSVGGWEYITGGYKGIIVYRYSPDEFMAFERACPHDWQMDAGYVNVDSSGLIMKCNNCATQYLIIDGSTVTGPGTQPLKQYRTEFDGQTLHVYN